MRRRIGNQPQLADADPVVDNGVLGDQSASVLIGKEQFVASAERPFVFGRADAEGVVGLDARDMGISAIAGSVECAWGVWWIINESSKRPLLLEHPGGPMQLRVVPGHRHAVTTDKVDVLVVGAMYTHLLRVVLPEGYIAGLRGGAGRLTTGTLTTEAVTLTERDRDALTALCAGYLESFPHRHDHPNTYDEAARLLSSDQWSGDRVRKAVERVKERFAKQQGLYFEGPHANYDLAAHLISSGLLSGEDLARLPHRRAQ